MNAVPHDTQAQNNAFRAKSNRPDVSERLYGSWTVGFVLVLTLSLTVGAYFLSSHHILKRSHEQFDVRADEITSAIERRLKFYEQMLRGGVALMNVVPVNREIWRNYVETLDLNHYWPGIQGIGYSVPIDPADLDKHQESVRAEGFPQYQVWPAGQRDFYTSIIYLEPFTWRNQRAFGYDMWSNEIRRKAMQDARDTGMVRVTSGVKLVQETDKNQQNGFLMYLPVYRAGEKTGTVEERRRALQGWVYSPFRSADLMNGILGSNKPDVRFEIYDGDGIRPETLIYSSDHEAPDEAGRQKPALSGVRRMEYQNSVWTIVFYSVEGSEFSAARWELHLVVAGGITTSLLLLYLIFSIRFLQLKAVRIAQEMTRELTEKTLQIEAVNQELEQRVRKRTEDLDRTNRELETRVTDRTEELAARVRELETLNGLMIGREKKMIELKKEIESLKAGVPPAGDTR